MKRTAYGALLLFLALLLSGCSSAPQTGEPLPTATPEPHHVEAPAITAQGRLADAARDRLAPYQASIAAAARQSSAVLTYTIPGDIINKMAQDAADTGAQPQDGRYRFTWQQSGNYTYSASAMQIAAIEEAAENTPSPLASQDPVMDNQQMGDFSATGGGQFDRICVYDLAEAMTDGTAEITDTLNGAATGHELFSFLTEQDRLYFVDATLDQAVDIDGLTATARYLVAAGVLRPDGLEIVEFTVPGKDQVPAVSAGGVQELLSAGNVLTRITVKGQSVTVFP